VLAVLHAQLPDGSGNLPDLRVVAVQDTHATDYDGIVPAAVSPERVLVTIRSISLVVNQRTDALTVGAAELGASELR